MNQLKPFQIIKEQPGLVWVESSYNLSASENEVHSDLHRFALENIVLEKYTLNPIFEKLNYVSHVEDLVRFVFKILGRTKTDDDRYVECVEYMIKNL